VLTHGVGEIWAQAAQMGVVLDPGNLLYGSTMRNTAEFSSASSKPVPAQPVVTSPPVADFEFKMEGLLDERGNDAMASLLAAPTGGHRVAAKSTTSDAASGTTASDVVSDLSNPIEFDLSDSLSSPISVSGLSLSSSWPSAAAQKFMGSGTQARDLASLKTKLDLAIACQEIGDHEGARELLAEVAVSSHLELSQRAQSLLSQLA